MSEGPCAPKRLFDLSLSDSMRPLSIAPGLFFGVMREVVRA